MILSISVIIAFWENAVNVHKDFKIFSNFGNIITMKKLHLRIKENVVINTFIGSPLWVPPVNLGDEDMGKPAQVEGPSQPPRLSCAWGARAPVTHMLRTGKKFRNTGQWEKMPRQDSNNNSISNKSDPQGASYIPTHLDTTSKWSCSMNSQTTIFPRCPQSRTPCDLPNGSWLSPEAGSYLLSRNQQGCLICTCRLYNTQTML